MQKLIDEVGGWDNMVKKANQSPQSMYKEWMADFRKLCKQEDLRVKTKEQKIK